jgi:hypothetical protein
MTGRRIFSTCRKHCDIYFRATIHKLMKKYLSILITVVFCLGLIPAFAQMGQMPGGSQFDGAMSKLFGDNSTFTAAMESQIKPKSGDLITMPGKIAFDSGLTRFEVNMTEAKGVKMPPGASEQMKSMGLDQMVTITQPKENFVYIIYPGLQSYVQTGPSEKSAATNGAVKVEATALGKETVDGHPCVENKVIISDDTGGQHEYTVWNATDLKNFPVKIIHVEQDNEITMSFKDVSLTKPAASEFVVPVGYTRYDNMQTMIQTEMMKKLGGGMGMPPGGMPPGR